MELERTVFRALNHAGDWPWLDWTVQTLAVPLFTLVLAGIFWRAAPGRLALRLAAGVTVLFFLFLLVLLCSEMTTWIGRARPGAVLKEVQTGSRVWSGPSFPSCNGMLWGGVAGLLPLLRVRRAVAIGLLAAMAGFSVFRVYQGAHWLSDVVAGFALGLGLAAGWTAGLRRWILRDAKPQL